MYGSYAYGLETEHSDLDIVVLAHKVNARRITTLSRRIITLHNEQGLSLDEEVPLKRKLLASWHDAHRAIRGEGFRSESGSLVIKPIEKTPAVLESEWVRLRLLMNALTGKYTFISGDKKALNELQVIGRVNWVHILPLLLGFRSFTASSFVEKLIGNGKVSGEMFLGFKDHPVIRSYLRNSFMKTFVSCLRKGWLYQHRHRYSLRDEKWLQSIAELKNE
jgi:hypothetical protein